jgi:phenylalanine-4-hydroxylase
LRASDEQIKKIERLYWYTIEFGLVIENGEVKAFGAGLLSSIGELTSIHTVSRRPFDPWVITETPYDTSRMQPHLFCAESYEDMRREIVRYLRGV